MFYFEVWKNDKLIRRGKKTLEPISIENELMYVPEFTLVLPIDWAECFDGWEEVKVYVNGKCFYGLVWDIEEDKAEEILTVTCRHIISEWEHRQISVNHAMSDSALNVVYKGDEIVSRFGIIVYPRGDEAAPALPENVKWLQAPLFDISSTEIRSAVAAGEDVSQWLHPDVVKFIKDKNLYL